jgi:GDP-4-dehydro-6-deoxy-D-mannose reductase
MSKIIVTGVNGFVGLHLARELDNNGHHVIGVAGLRGSKEKPDFIKEYLQLDLTNIKEASKIDFSDVDCVIDLAGLAALRPSFDDPMLYMRVNVGIEVNLYETALKQKVSPRFLIISSGTLYDPKEQLPLNEDSRVSPNSPYAVSKMGQEQMAMYYQSRGFESIIARTFNHVGPGQDLGFIFPDLSHQIISVEKGDKKEINVGNLDSKRDYTDVRDIVRAYRLLIDKGKAGEIYNVCSSKALSGHEILNGLVAQTNINPQIVEDSSKMRPSDTPIVYGSHHKLTTDTGWKPEIPIEITFADIIADWRTR